MDYDLGHIDWEEKSLQPLENPFGPKVLPMSPDGQKQSGAAGGIRTSVSHFGSISCRIYVASYPKFAIFARNHYTLLHAGCRADGMQLYVRFNISGIAL